MGNSNGIPIDLSKYNLSDILTLSSPNEFEVLVNIEKEAVRSSKYS